MPLPLRTPEPRTREGHPLPVLAGSPVRSLLDCGVLLAEEWDDLPTETRTELLAITDPETARAALVARHLLTRFQADAIRVGNVADLTIGHYRILEPLGHGGMGVVYRAEHRHLRRPVAIKVMSDRCAGNQRLLDRFNLEARAVARLQHPNIVACLDAGHDTSRPRGPSREYYVMDLVPGADLQATVAHGGPLPVHRAADLFRQVAEALAEAHRVGLVHRDIKPSNILVTPDWRAKILDFGLARHPSRQMTEPGVILGTIGYMAPEQVNDASRVDGRADVFSLGASLFLALTGVEPFDTGGSPYMDLTRRLSAPTPRVRRHRPELPTDLDDLVAKLMDSDPGARFPSASAVAAALIPFTHWRPDAVSVPGAAADTARPRVLVIDDDADVRDYIRSLLDADYDCHEAADGRIGLDLVEGNRFDLVIVDQEMPRMDGAKCIAKLLQVAPWPGPMVLYMSGRVPTASLGGLLLAGADDFIRKPFTDTEFLSRVRGVLNRRAAQQSARMSVGDPGASVRVADPRAIDPVDLFARGVGLLLEEIGYHPRGYPARLPGYIGALAAGVGPRSGYSRLADPAFVDLLGRVAPSHDLGLATVPATILMKPGRLDPDERLTVQMHATVGAGMVSALAAAYPGVVTLELAAEVARHHHERWDGAGYPDGLAGETIPLSARVVAVASVYDALRSRRPFRPALSHPRAVRLMTAESPGVFDPVLMSAFAAVADQFDRVFQTTPR